MEDEPWPLASDRYDPHLHGVFLDGVFVEGQDGEPGFVELPELSDMDVCELLSARVLSHRRPAHNSPPLPPPLTNLDMCGT